MTSPPTRPPRPLLVGNEWVSTRAGGLNRYLADLLAALRRAGAEPAALVVGDGGGAGVVGVSGPEESLPRRLLAVRRASAGLAADVDVVDVHFALYGLLPVWTTWLRRRPLVVHFQGPWAAESEVARAQGRVVVAAKAAVERAVYRRAHTVVVLSGAFGRLVVDRYGVDASRVVVVPPGVDLERFTPGDRAAARRRLDLPAGRFVAVAVRRLDARMGLDLLVEAWAQVQQACPGAVLVIAGEGRERPRLEQARAALADPSGVRLVGRVGDDGLVELYRAADCSVVPTRALEGFGLVTLESAACGSPAVVTDVGGLPDGVVGLDPSLVVAAGDARALGDRLVAAAGGDLPSPEAARRHAESFSWDAVARHHLDLYAAAAQPRLRVAYVGHTAALSGGELALARVLPALGDVDPVVILGEDGPLVERLRAGGIAVELLPMDPRARDVRRHRVGRRLPGPAVVASLRYAWVLSRRLRALRADVVHTNTLKAALYGGLAGRLAGVPVVWHVRDRIAADYLPGAAVRIVRALSRVLPRVVIANSQATAETISGPGVPTPHVVHDAAGLGRPGVTVIPSPVDVGVAPAETAAPGLGRPLTVGMVGRLAPWKGQDVFLRAFAAAFPGGDARARIVGSAMFGEDGWAGEIDALATSLGIADRVDFVGFVDDVAGEYARMDVVVHASTVPEPFGQVVVEAMAAGRPVVAAAAGGPAEVVTDGVDGLLYPMGDAAALGERLRALAVDPGLRRRLGEAGRRRAGDFSPARVAAQIDEVYRALAPRRRRPSTTSTTASPS